MNGAPLTAPLRATFAAFAALALMAGVLLVPLAAHTDRWFSWTIKPPLTAAFLGAAYWAALVLLAWAASRQSWSEAQVAIPPVLTIAVLLLAATWIHLDRFHFDTVFGWFWLVVYNIVPVLLVALLLVQPHTAGRTDPPLPNVLRAVLAAQAVVMCGVGVLLWVSPDTGTDVWPWALTPLTARAIGSFVIGFGVAAAHAATAGSARRFAGAAYAYATLGALELLVAALHPDDFAGDAARTIPYLAFVASVLGVGLYGVALARKAASASSRS